MTPRSSKQFEEIREERKTLIMDVALEHFAKEGFHNTTITHIAKHAGISKGLMYNYFESKESLLSEIIMRSVTEGYEYFDINRDGYLSEDEFEFFVRRVSLMLKEKKSFWRLLFQLIMQNEVRETLVNSFLGSGSDFKGAVVNPGEEFIKNIVKILTEYFVRKMERKGPDYDPYLDLNMFIITMKGFALTDIYRDSKDDAYYEQTISAIINLYK